MGIVSKRLRDSARGQDCTLRFLACNGDPATTVLCHLPSLIGLKGMAMKTPDYWAVFGCSYCHERLDRYEDRVDVWTIMRALERTWEIWFDMGLLRCDEVEPRAAKPSKKIVERKLSWQSRGR
jgi:hypothetical protein